MTCALENLIEDEEPMLDESPSVAALEELVSGESHELDDESPREVAISVRGLAQVLRRA